MPPLTFSSPFLYDSCMFDAHLHSLPKPIPQDWKGILCTISKSAWNPAADHESVVTSLGLLPQYLPQPFDSTVIDEVEAYLIANPKLQIGEVGADKRYAQQIAIEEQLLWCEAFLKLAQRHNRLVSLHVVHAEGAILELLKRIQVRSIWHGYSGSIEFAHDLNRVGCIVSLGPSVWGTKLGKHLKELSEIGFFLETDWPDGRRPQEWAHMDYLPLLEAQYARAAKEAGMDQLELEELINAKRTLFAH